MLGTFAATGTLLLALHYSSVDRLQEQVQEGQDAIYSLEFDKAEKIFTGLIESHPDDPVGYAFVALTMWNRLLRAAGNLALENYATPTPFTRRSEKPLEKETARFHEANAKLMGVCDRLLSEDPEDVSALYFKGVAFENQATEALAIRRKYLEAWREGRKAVELHERVLKLDPSFVDAKLSIGSAEFTRAVLPWSIKFLTLFLLSGDKQAALQKINDVIEHGRWRRLDAQIVMVFLQSWKGDPKESVRILNSLRVRYPSNYLLDLNLAAIYQGVLHDPERALGVYLALLDSLKTKAPGLAPGELYYRIATTYYDLKNYDAALAALRQALHTERGEKETETLSLFLIGQIYDDQGEVEKARPFYIRGLEKAPPGNTISAEVAQARRRLK